jgi:hypothetical protein
VLVEHEWLAFGHKFSERCGHASADAKSVERSPIFLQFLDCVFQLQLQYPGHFEFNEDFLLAIYDHLFSCRFGTFLFQCEQQRRAAKLSEKTESLWTYLLDSSHREAFYNPCYAFQTLPDVSADSLLVPNTSSKRVALWEGVYLRVDRECREHTGGTRHVDFGTGILGGGAATRRADHRALFHAYEALRAQCLAAGLTPTPEADIWALRQPGRGLFDLEEADDAALEEESKGNGDDGASMDTLELPGMPAGMGSRKRSASIAQDDPNTAPTQCSKCGAAWDGRAFCDQCGERLKAKEDEA